MAVNPITFDKMEPVIIKKIETRLVESLVHEIKGSEIDKDEFKKRKKNLLLSKKEKEKYIKLFGEYLQKHNFLLDYEILETQIKIKIKDSNGNILIESYVLDIKSLYDSIHSTGGIIDTKG